MSMTIGEVAAALDSLVPFETAEEWDNVGLICGDPHVCVAKCFVALNPTPGSIDYVARAGGNLLVTHHPPFIEPPEKALPPTAPDTTFAGATLFAALSNSVAIISLHTNLDSSPLVQGVFSRALGLEYKEPFFKLQEERAYGQCARMRTNRNTAEELSRWVCEAIGTLPRVWGNPHQRIEEIVILNGSADEFIDELIARKTSCVIVGELKYHHALALASKGMVIIELGHDVSELPLLPVLNGMLTDLGIQSDIISNVDSREYWWQPG